MRLRAFAPRMLAALLLWTVSSSARAEEAAPAESGLVDRAADLVDGCGGLYAGSPGNSLLSSRVETIFREAGVPCGSTEYDAAVFVPGAASITVDGREIALDALHPNQAELSNLPVDEDNRFSGRVVWLDDGDLDDLDGKQLEGALCVFRFDCGDNYVDVMKYGALGCLFVAPEREAYLPEQAYDKILNIPLDIPRYQISREDGAFLRERATGADGLAFEGRAEPNRWDRKPLRNHWALVEGSDPGRKGELVVFYAGMDTLNYCPGAPGGAEEILNLRLLLDLFERYRAHPPKRSVLFLAVNGSKQYDAGAAEAVFHLFGDGDQIFIGLDDQVISEEKVVRRAGERSRYLIDEYRALDPTAMSQEVIKRLKEQEDMVAGKKLVISDVLIAKIDADVFDISQQRLFVTRQMRRGAVTEQEGREELDRLGERIKVLGGIVSMFDKDFSGLLEGRTAKWSDMSDEQKDLFFDYVAEIIEEAENDLARSKVYIDRLERIRDSRTLLTEEKGVRPLLAVGLRAGFENRRLAMTPGSIATDAAAVEKSFDTSVLGELGSKFLKRLDHHAEVLGPQHGVFWESGKQDARMFKDMAPPTCAQFLHQRIPAFDLMSPYSRNNRMLSAFDTLDAVDAAMADRKAVFVVDMFDRILDEDDTRENLTMKDDRRGWRSVLTNTLSGSGEIVSRIQDGSSITAPQTILRHALVVVPLMRPPKIISALKGGVLTHRIIPTDVGGRGFYYNLPYATYEAKCYGYDDAGHITHAVDYGQTKLRSAQNISPGKVFAEATMLASAELVKCDLYDVCSPLSLSPVGSPLFEGGKGRKVSWHSYDGFFQGGIARGDGMGCIFLPEEYPVKILLTGSVFLVNPTEEEPTGEGYPVPGLHRESVPRLAARDLIDLNAHRIDMLRRNAVKNELMQRLHDDSRDFYGLGEKGDPTPETLAAARKRTELFRTLDKAYGAAAKAYPIVTGTIGDMMKAVVFYLVVLIPFAFFLQRLLFSFVKVEAQIASFAGVFAGTYLIFHLIHPAFKIAENPHIVIIAFTMLMLAGFVSFAMKGKFDVHMESFKERFAGEEGVGVLKLAGTAMLVGVTNMKRRRVRTTLTCATIVLITFTMLSFTSVSQNVAPTRIRKADTAPYNGIFCAHDAWAALNDRKVRRLTKVLGKGRPTLRRGFASFPIGEESVVTIDGDERSIPVSGLLALETAENGWAGLGRMPVTAGRWFSTDDAREILVTDVFAKRTLNLAYEEGAPLPETWIRLDGMRLRLVGVLDSREMARRQDLRNATILPKERGRQDPFAKKVDVSQLAEFGELPEGTFQDTGPQFYVVVPFGLRDVFGIDVKSVSIQFDTAQEVWDRIEDFVLYSNDRVHFGATEPFEVVKAEKEGEEPVLERPGRYYLGSGYGTSIGGLSSLIIPLLISATIIFNTMLGAVYERKREIGIFNAIGLNPVHVALFFVAEAVVYGILGGVGGYLIGQVLAKIIMTWQLLPGINLNYSSLSVVYVIVFTILIVVISTIYPAVQAMKTASASSGRRKPEKKSENELYVQFPFSFTREMAVAVNSYLKEYFDKHEDSSVGGFTAQPVACLRDGGDGDDLAMTLRYHVALAPYDLGVTQTVTVKTVFNEEVGAFMVHSGTERTSGQDNLWEATNQPFLNEIRKYLLHWRILTREGQEEHLRHGAEIFDVDMGDRFAAAAATAEAAAGGEASFGSEPAEDGATTDETTSGDGDAAASDAEDAPPSADSDDETTDDDGSEKATD